MIYTESAGKYTRYVVNPNIIWRSKKKNLKYCPFPEEKAQLDFPELNLAESFSVLAFYMYGGMYNIFNGTEVENIAVDFINEATGQIINSANSSDIGE